MAFSMGAMIGAIGNITKAVGDYGAAQDEAGNLELQAYNAEQNAQLLEKAGEEQRGKVRTSSRRMLARAIAIAAASGRDVRGGSPLASIEAIERAFVLDEQAVAYNTGIAVGRERSQAALFYSGSKAVKRAARTGLYASLLGVGADTFKSFTPGKAKSTVASKSLSTRKHAPVTTMNEADRLKIFGPKTYGKKYASQSSFYKAEFPRHGGHQSRGMQ